MTKIVKNSTKSGENTAGAGGDDHAGGSETAADSTTTSPNGGALGRLEAHVEKKAQDQAFTGWRKLVGAGFEFFGIVLICALVGMWLDDKFKLGGMGALGGIIVGAAGGAYLQIRNILQNDRK